MNCGPVSHGAAYVGALQRATAFAVDLETLLCFSTTDTLCFTISTTAIAPATGSSATVPANKIEIRRTGSSLQIESRFGPIIGVWIYNALGVCVRQSERIVHNRVTVPMEGQAHGVYLASIMMKNGTIAVAVKVTY